MVEKKKTKFIVVGNKVYRQIPQSGTILYYNADDRDNRGKSPMELKAKAKRRVIKKKAKRMSAKENIFNTLDKMF
jgi:hypothetical protein